MSCGESQIAAPMALAYRPAMQRVAYLLCELKARDFEPRLLIAAALLKAGCAVVVGQRWGIAYNGPTAPQGCALFPTANAIQAATMATVAQGGHIIAAADEEALALAGPAMLEILAPESLKHAVFFAHSDLHARTVSAAFPGSNITVTGSARIDLCAAQVTNVRKSDSAYVLLNTNFPLTNSLWGSPEDAQAQLNMGGLQDAADRVAWEARRRAAFMPVLTWLLENFAGDIVIRPHPAEKADLWQGLAAQTSNVRVVVGESPGPWLAGASLVIHTDSTTGLEAAVMGRPVLNISTEPDWGAKFVMRFINTTVTSAEAAIAALAGFRASGTLPPPPQSAAEMYPARGAQRTADAIVRLLEARGATPLGGDFRWQPVNRPDVLKKKITISREEVADSPHIKPTHAAVHQIDESLFLLVPARR